MISTILSAACAKTPTTSCQSGAREILEYASLQQPIRNADQLNNPILSKSLNVVAIL